MCGKEYHFRGISIHWTDLIVWLPRLKCAYLEIAVQESSIIIQIDDAQYFNEEKRGNQNSEQTTYVVLAWEHDFQLEQKRCYLHIHRVTTLWNSINDLRIFG